MMIIIYFHDSMSLHIYFIIEKINVLLLSFFNIDKIFCEDVIIYFHDYMLRQIFLFDLLYIFVQGSPITLCRRNGRKNEVHRIMPSTYLIIF